MDGGLVGKRSGADRNHVVAAAGDPADVRDDEPERDRRALRGPCRSAPARRVHRGPRHREMEPAPAHRAECAGRIGRKAETACGWLHADHGSAVDVDFQHRNQSDDGADSDVGGAGRRRRAEAGGRPVARRRLRCFHRRARNTRRNTDQPYRDGLVDGKCRRYADLSRMDGDRRAGRGADAASGLARRDLGAEIRRGRRPSREPGNPRAAPRARANHDTGSPRGDDLCGGRGRLDLPGATDPRTRPGGPDRYRYRDHRGHPHVPRAAWRRCIERSRQELCSARLG